MFSKNKRRIIKMRRGMIKYLVISAAFAVAMNTYAMNNGFYLGIMMGPATNNGSTIEAQVNPAQLDSSQLILCPKGADVNQLCTTPANPRSSQFGTRIYLGNQFNQYAAVEGGVTLFSSIRYDAKGVPVYGGTDQRVRALDIVGKGIMPLAMFSIYGKLGIAVTYITTGGALNPTFTDSTNPSLVVTSGSNTYKNKFAPTYSLGASYDLNQSWQVDLSYNTIQVGNNIGSVVLYGIGISYHFTDKYCGQFLCDE
jgi:opacity protein-like surface antigen